MNEEENNNVVEETKVNANVQNSEEQKQVAPQNNDWKTVGGAGPEKKKKGMGPVKAILLTLLIVFLMAVIGLLIRMVVAGDGDYFAPIKQVFGISDEKDDEEEEKEEESVTSKVDKESGKTTERLSLLSKKATKSGVKHYSMKISLKDVMEIYQEIEESGANLTDFMELSKTSNTTSKNPTVKKVSDNDFDFSNSKIEPRISGFEDDYEDYDDDDFYFNYEGSPDWDNAEFNINYDDQISPLYDLPDDDDDYVEDDFEMYAELLEEYAEIIDGDIYLDLYAKKNEIVQLVIGVDYMPMIEKYYKYSKDDISEIGSFDSAEDFAKYISSTLRMFLNKETLIEGMMEEIDPSYGITEEDLEEIIDFKIGTGLFEFYITFNEDLNDLLADYIEENEDEIEELGIDVDNIFETAVPIFNKQMKDEGYSKIFKITVE